MFCNFCAPEKLIKIQKPNPTIGDSGLDSIWEKKSEKAWFNKQPSLQKILLFLQPSSNEHTRTLLVQFIKTTYTKTRWDLRKQSGEVTMDQEPKKMIDGEDLGIEMDKMDAAQLGKTVDIDQAKVEKDVEALIALAKSGQKQQAIDSLLAIEKQGRLAEDIVSTRLACRTIVQVQTPAH